MNVWKIASRWSNNGNSESSVLNLFRKYNIAFVYDDKIHLNHVVSGDLFAISDGLRIVSIGKVLDKARPINEFEIDELYVFNEDGCTVGFKIELIDLSDIDIFIYEKWGRFHGLHNEVKDKVVSLFEKYKIETTSNYVLSLKEIAQWCDGVKSLEGVLGEVPVLQRGLVWDQAQIELLWDSILRGIPIGSIVLSRITDSIINQRKTKNVMSKDATHFILDGQQRCNSIALGFESFPKDDKSILWFDLDTNFKSSNSTREFLVRLTTKAHPWGFNTSDDAGRLGVGKIRNKVLELKKGEEINFADLKKYLPKEIFPFDANCPIPLSILLNANETQFWEGIKSALNEFDENEFVWAKNALDFIESEKINKNKIQKAILLVKSTKIVALNVPNSLLEPSREENNSDINDGITNIEHLFQRLNRQGTNLDGEELVYSMMKSYFPEIAGTIDKVSERKMPASKLLQQSIRVALSDEKGLKGVYNVSQIRRISTSNDLLTEKKRIKSFIDNNLEKSVEVVDKWLTNDNQTWGLPAVLKTSVAISSPDVYCLLLYIATKHPDIDEKTYNRIVGIALFIHWFVDDKKDAVSILFKAVYDINSELVLIKLYEIIKNDEKLISYVKRLQNPEFLEKIIHFEIPDLTKWEWSFCRIQYHEIMKEVQSDKDKNDSEYDKNVSPCLTRLKERHEFLLYVQREFLRKRFWDYDPARKDLWKEINRPWDYDHILPNVYVRGKWDKNIYKKFCDEWVSTNGNLRAWPFEDNRSDQAINTKDKMLDRHWDDSYIDENEKDGYSDASVINDKIKALNFAVSCRSRIIRMYKEWYDNFHIEELIIS